MFVQIKAIRKGYKPPRWRRAYLPMHITFSQMAYILEPGFPKHITMGSVTYQYLV